MPNFDFFTNLVVASFMPPRPYVPFEPIHSPMVLMDGLVERRAFRIVGEGQFIIPKGSTVKIRDCVFDVSDLDSGFDANKPRQAVIRIEEPIPDVVSGCQFFGVREEAERAARGLANA